MVQYLWRVSYRTFMVMNKLSPWIAIVDDDKSICRALSRLLRAADIQGKTFSSGAAFLEFSNMTPPCCVILDLHMPDISGFDLQSWLALHSPDMQVIVMTGEDSVETERRVRAHCPLAYLHKPMNDQVLLDAVQRALENNAAKSPNGR
jgi:FixJ family two-component response regulator